MNYILDEHYYFRVLLDYIIDGGEVNVTRLTLSNYYEIKLSLA